MMRNSLESEARTRKSPFFMRVSGFDNKHHSIGLFYRYSLPGVQVSHLVEPSQMSRAEIIQVISSATVVLLRRFKRRFANDCHGFSMLGRNPENS